MRHALDRVPLLWWMTMVVYSARTAPRSITDVTYVPGPEVP